MCKHFFFLKTVFLVFLVVTLAGCAVRSVHNTSYVSDSIYSRTGHDLRPAHGDFGCVLKVGIWKQQGKAEGQHAGTDGHNERDCLMPAHKHQQKLLVNHRLIPRNAEEKHLRGLVFHKSSPLFGNPQCA